jgi:hypothetical protein
MINVKSVRISIRIMTEVYIYYVLKKTVPNDEHNDKVITLRAYIQSADFTFVPCLETFLYTFLVFSEPYVGGGGVVSFTSGLYRM